MGTYFYLKLKCLDKNIQTLLKFSIDRFLAMIFVSKFYQLLPILTKFYQICNDFKYFYTFA